MSGRAGRACAPAGVLLLAGTVALAGAQDTLRVEARSWVVAGRPLELRIEPLGPLAGRRLTVTVFVDDERAADVPLPRAAALHSLPTASLAPGRHRILVKSGSERATLEVRVLPAWLPWAAGLGVAVVLALSVRLRRHRP